MKNKESRVSGTIFQYPGKLLPTLVLIVIFRNRHFVLGKSSRGLGGGGRGSKFPKTRTFEQIQTLN